MGDCYSGGNQTGRNDADNEFRPGRTNSPQTRIEKDSGLKPKDLVGQPWRLAFALQADGWYLRSDIIWAKPNPMPEPVTDRPTKAHEYIFLLSKAPRYFYDQESVREPLRDDPETYLKKMGTKSIETGTSEEVGAGRKNGGFNTFKTDKSRQRVPNGRNSRTVWEIATQPYPEAHFATFPEELPRRCIKAGTSEKGCCPKCGASWERIVESTRDYNPKPIEALSPNGGQDSFTLHRDGGGVYSSKKATGGWQPTCSCGESETVPCVVLDPFAGSGTTGAVARSMGRSSILIELNPEYVKLIRERCETSHVALETFTEAIQDATN
jgi:hypothetical protein